MPVQAAVMFSGGVDSFCNLCIAIDKHGKDGVVAVYYDVGQVYAAREIEASEKITALLGARFVVRSPMLLEEDRDTAQIEYRNAFFLLWTATMPERPREIYFGMLKGETPPDKNPLFVKNIQQILAAGRKASAYRDASDIAVVTPYARFTKAAMVRRHIERYGRFGLLRTVACFKGENAGGVMCGTCWSCINRWVAWAENGLPEEAYSIHPADALIEKSRAAIWGGGKSRRGAWNARRLGWAVECVRQVRRHISRTGGDSLARRLFR